MRGQYPKIYLYKRIVLAKLYVDTHFAENINLENISGEAFFSKFHFARLFKKIYGQTPHQYLTRVRMEKALELLQKGHSVTETCFALGFDSLTSFTALFRKYTKSAPSVYRQEALKRKKQIGETPLQFIPGCFAHQYGWLQNSNFREAR